MSGFFQCGGCDSEELGARYDKAFCKTETRPFGYDKIIGFHCSLNFNDFLDTSELGEWDQALTDGKVLVSPFFGKFAISDGSSETFEDGCGRKQADSTTYPWEFTTISAAPDYSDEDWWYAFHKQFNQYSWGYFNCDGNLYISDDSVSVIKAALAAVPVTAVPLINPGHSFSLNTIPQFVELNGAGKAGQWKVSGEFLANSVLRGVKIPGLNALVAEKG